MNIEVATCIGCGCDDQHACKGPDDLPCHWLDVDYARGHGVCSLCPDSLDDFRSGDYAPLVPRWTFGSESPMDFKFCVKCGQRIDAPQLAVDEPERCENCGDPE